MCLLCLHFFLDHFHQWLALFTRLPTQINNSWLTRSFSAVSFMFLFYFFSFCSLPFKNNLLCLFCYFKNFFYLKNYFLPSFDVIYFPTCYLSILRILIQSFLFGHLDTVNFPVWFFIYSQNLICNLVSFCYYLLSKLLYG